MQTHEDIPAMIDDLIRFGVIEAVDGARATVKCGEIISPPLPWLSLAGNWTAWLAPTVGQQVVILCPSGDITGALILNGLYSNPYPAPLLGVKAQFKCPDGTTITYDPIAHALDIQAGAGTVKISASGGIELTGPVKITGAVDITGDVTVTGKITASDDVIASGKSLKSHKHGLVQSGTAQSGTPI